MPLKTTVKVSHISNLSDARYCAGMGVDMLGFQVIPGGEHYMTPERFQDIRGWISGPAIIAEMYGVSSPSEIASVLETYAPDYLELSLAEFLNFRSYLTLPCIVHISPRETGVIEEGDHIAYLLVDAGVACADLSGVSRPVLAGVDSADQLNQKISEGCFRGFVLQAPRELRPGITSYEQLGSILEALDVD